MRTIFECLLFVRSPHLKDITLDHLRAVIGRRPPRTGTYCAFAISRVLAKIGAIPEPMEIARPFVVRAELPEITEGVPLEWARLCRRWLDTATRLRPLPAQELLLPTEHWAMVGAKNTLRSARLRIGLANLQPRPLRPPASGVLATGVLPPQFTSRTTATYLNPAHMPGESLSFAFSFAICRSGS